MFTPWEAEELKCQCSVYVTFIVGLTIKVPCNLVTIALAYALASSSAIYTVTRHAGMDSVVNEEGVNRHAGVGEKPAGLLFTPTNDLAAWAPDEI